MTIAWLGFLAPDERARNLKCDPTAAALLCSLLEEKRKYSFTLEQLNGTITRITVRLFGTFPGKEAVVTLAYKASHLELSVDAGFQQHRQNEERLPAASHVRIVSRFSSLRPQGLTWLFEYQRSATFFGDSSVTREQGDLVVYLQETPLSPGWEVYFCVTKTGDIVQTLFGL